MNARREIRMQQLERTSTTPQLVLSDLCLLVIGRLMALKGGEAAQWQNPYANIIKYSCAASHHWRSFYG